MNSSSVPSAKRKTTAPSPALRQIRTIEEAFNLLNAHFFEGILPHCMINQQHKKSDGYFSPNRWSMKGDENNHIHEINLTPSFMNGSDENVMATLLHEMVRLWQHHNGKPSRTGYHNREWAEKMLSVGLRPVSPGYPGKMTGQKVIHQIIRGGPFDQLMMESAIQIIYYSTPGEAKKNKIKYSCACSNNVWGKPGLNFTCCDCEKRFREIQLKEKMNKTNRIVSYGTIL